MSAITGVNDSGLEAEDAGGFAAFEGQIGDLIGVEGVPEAGVLGIHDWSGSSDLDDGLRPRHSHGDIQRGWSVNHQGHVAALLLGEAGGANDELVGRGRDLEKLIDTLVVARGVSDESRLRVG